MNAPVSWSETSVDGSARAGVMNTPHGAVRTPAFMAVGTRATVKTLDADDLEQLAAQRLEHFGVGASVEEMAAAFSALSSLAFT